MITKQSKMTSKILEKQGNQGSMTNSPAKSKGFFLQASLCLLCLQGGFLLSLGILGHRVLPALAGSNVLTLMPESQAEHQSVSMSSSLHSCIYHGGSNTNICKKQLLPSGLQHPRTKVSPTNLIYFPLRVPQV